MSDIKRVTWMQRNIGSTYIDKFLTDFNLQPGKFVILPAVDGSPGSVTIVYVEKEEDYVRP